LPILSAARQQQRERRLVVVDGARLFALGWLAALAALFDIGDTERFTTPFLAVAEQVRPNCSTPTPQPRGRTGSPDQV
jgi:hypothetical protein